MCSRCGTRWNVRDSQRVWCPRCNGPLLAPTASPPPYAASGHVGGPVPRDQPRATARLPAGFRWIAVRPGPPPPPRVRRRVLGPTPRYRSVPRWGLVDQRAPVAAAAPQAPRRSPSIVAVRATLLAASAIFVLAALAHTAGAAVLITLLAVALARTSLAGGRERAGATATLPVRAML